MIVLSLKKKMLEAKKEYNKTKDSKLQNEIVVVIIYNGQRRL